MNLPGSQVVHRWITDECIKTHGEMTALDIVIKQIENEFVKCRDGWKGVEGVEYHIALTVKRPEAKEKTNG